MSTDARTELEGTGPIDFVVLEWADGRPNGAEIAPLIIDLVEKGIIRLLDIAFVSKDADGTATAIDLESLPEGSAFSEFAGASSGLIGHDDVQEAAAALEPGAAAAILIWENTWVLPVATALRKSGGQLVADGRIPVPAIVAALDALDAIA